METKQNLDVQLEKYLGELGDRRLQKFSKDDGKSIGNFMQAREKADEINSRSDHFKTQAKYLAVKYEDENLFLEDRKTDRKILFSSFGLSKFCTQINVSADYIKRCLANNREELAEMNMNSWLQTMPKDKEVLVRTTDNRLYAMLTDKYSMLDDHDVLEQTYDVLSPTENYTVVNSLVRPEYMKVRLVSRERVMIGSDELQFGFDVKNSRVGNGSLEVSLLMYRMICCNGCLVGGAQGVLYRKRHVGIDSADFIDNFKKIITQAPNAIGPIKASVWDSQNKELTNERVQNILDRFVAQSFATKNMRGQVEQMLHENYEMTEYGVLNAMTEVAQQYNYDARESIEEFAGQMIFKK